MVIKQEQPKTPEENYENAALELALYRMLQHEREMVKADSSEDDEKETQRITAESTPRTEKEVCNIYAVLKYLVETNNSIYHGVAMGYSSSTKFQDKIKGFNERFIMVLIGHIERYLTKVGIDMGLDDKVVYNVTVHKGQAIIATDNASVTATNYFGVDANKLNKLIAEVQIATSSLAEEDQQTVSECLEVIETEAVAEKPKKGMIKTALSALQTVKGVAEFGAAVATLVEFISPLL